MHRIGLIGRGTWGQLLFDRLESLEADVVVVDPAVDGRTLSAKHPGRVDGWVIATPANTHVEVLDQVSELSDAPVFCEKPFTTNGVEAQRLAGVYGDRLHLMHVWRYHPGVEALGEIARSGAIGKVDGVRSTRTNWTSPRTDVDAIWNLLPHDLTIAVEILGAIPTPRSARAERIAGRAVSMWADLGAVGEPWLIAEVSNRFADKRREVRVHGSEGVAVLPSLDATVIEIARGSGAEPDLELRPFAGAEPVTRELQAFLDHLSGGSPPKSDAAEGVAVVHAVEALRLLASVDTST